MSNKHQELLQLAQIKNSDANPSYLLSQGANPNIRDPFYHKWTPLHYAVFLNKENFALQLIDHSKTNPLLLDSDGFSPLYWASKKSTARVIKALLSKGCDPNERDMHGMTALFAAVTSNKKENVAALLSHPTIDVNQPNQFGGSALHHTAYATDNVEIADLLVKGGANLFLYDYENQAPLHVAKRRKRKNLFKYFKLKMEENEPSWKCDISNNGWESPTEPSTTSGDDDMMIINPNNIQKGAAALNDVSPDVIDLNDHNNNHSNNSNHSNFSQQSSNSSNDRDNNNNDNNDDNEYKEYSSISNDRHFANNYSDPIKLNKRAKDIKAKPKKQISQSPGPQSIPRSNNPRQSHPNNAHHSHHSHHLHRQQRLKQVQENKLKIALKIEQSQLNKEARDLLQEQQYYFQYEQEVFYESMKHEYDKLHYQLNHFVNLSKELIKTNTQLKHENIKIKMALKYAKVGGHGQNILITKKKSESKSKKEFKKWFIKEIGTDFMIYYEYFVNSGFDDLRTIRHINHEQDLIDLGIDKKGHRLHILDKIENYRLQYHQINQDDVALPAFQQNSASSPIKKSLFLNHNNNDIDCIEGTFKTQ